MPLTHVAQAQPAADVLHSKEKIHANKGFHANNYRLGYGMRSSLVDIHRRFRENSCLRH